MYGQFLIDRHVNQCGGVGVLCPRMCVYIYIYIYMCVCACVYVFVYVCIIF